MKEIVNQLRHELGDMAAALWEVCNAHNKYFFGKLVYNLGKLMDRVIIKYVKNYKEEDHVKVIINQPKLQIQ